MGEYVFRIAITPNTLKGAPYTRNRGQEAEETRMAGIALPRVVPIVGVQAKEEFNILIWLADLINEVQNNIPPCCRSRSKTYLQGRSLGTRQDISLQRTIATARVSIAHGSVYLISYHGVKQPRSTTVVENRRREKQDQRSNSNEDDRVVNIDAFAPKATKVQPHEQAEEKEEETRKLWRSAGVPKYCGPGLPLQVASNQDESGYRIQKQKYN